MRYLPLLFVVLVTLLPACSEKSREGVGPSPAGTGAGAGAGAGAGLVERSLLDSRLTLSVPAEFVPMDDAMLRLKYPSERRPAIVLTNPQGTVNVAINHTANSLSEPEIPAAHAAMEKMFRSLYPSAEWFRSEVTTINGRKAFVMDVRTPAVDTEVRNIMVGTPLDGRLLILTFNCTKELEPTWEPVGQRVIASTVVSD